MNILIIYDTKIQAWLIGESLESAEGHIRNGYPELLESWQAGTLKAEVIEVPDEDAFRVDLYEIVDNQVKQISSVKDENLKV